MSSSSGVVADDENRVRLFSKQSQAIFFNYKPQPVQRMLDFDYLCQRSTPSVAGLITPGTTPGFQKVFFGTKEILLPIYSTTSSACSAQPQADVFINFASFRSAIACSIEALQQPSIRVVVIVAEGIPETDSRKLIALARSLGKTVIGPATVGGIRAGEFKIGDTAGTMENILRCRLYRPGSVGFVSKSGGLSNEIYSLLARTTDGLCEGVAIGGDAFAGSTLEDHVRRFGAMDEIKLIVVLGEIGGVDEHEIAKAISQGALQGKPLIAWVSGTCASLFPTEVQFGHAGAKSGKERESAHAKLAALREAGALVPDSFEGLPELIRSTFQDLVSRGVVTPREEPTPPSLPDDWQEAHRSGRVRRSTGIVSTICDDRGEEPTYSGVPISDLITGDPSIGTVLGLLWFKRRLPTFATKFIELCLVLLADHGPCVSGAHNTIVAARAGKDLVSCVASGMLTIGPRFGGAIDGAARYFKEAMDQKLAPDEFVESMKKRGIRIPGIGHRIKSADNLDKRVIFLQEYARKHFPSLHYLEFALAVEKFTLTKAPNLLLNVDGCIAALFLDLMYSCSSFSEPEIAEIVEIGYLNGFFILARTMGLVGHALDQMRLKQGLWRGDWDDVNYASGL